MRTSRYIVSLAACCQLLAGCLAFADDPPYACWNIGASDDWASTNWNDGAGASLPAPGYPTNNYWVEIDGGTVSVASQDVSIASLCLTHESVLTVTNGRTLTATETVNFHPTSRIVGYVAIPNGCVNLCNNQTGAMYGLSFSIGINDTGGHLDFGATWGTTNGYQSDAGCLYRTTLNLVNGGLRVDASRITMQTTCAVYNAGQEMTFRGDWLNPDASTLFAVNGSGTGTIDITGNFAFGGCKLNATVDTNGVSLILVGGDAILSNTALTVGATDALTVPEDTYDLIRVPVDKTIFTNGMVCSVASNGGFTYAVSLDENRGGYNYLVITPGEFLPSVTITNPTDDAMLTAVTDIEIQANASARSGAIAKVEFFADTNKVGESTNTPYSVTWSNVYAGCYELKAIVSDNNNNQGSSPVIDVNVQGTTTDGRKVFITGGAIITYDPGCVQ